MLNLNPALQDEFIHAIQRLVELSENDHYDPFTELVWPETIADDQYWMSQDLLTVYATPWIDQLSPAQLMSLSKFESVNFYSLNVHGIRELVLEVVKRIHTPGFELPSEYFHHFIDEENKHMWYFARFCLRYGGRLYEDRKIKFDGFTEPDIQNFLVFVRILIFEEIVDYFNTHMADDPSLHPTIREINRLHHKDESRHIAFGRQIVKILHQQLREHHQSSKLMELDHYLKRYIVASLQSLYSPAVYRDAGLPNPYDLRVQVLQHPARQAQHERYLKKLVSFLAKNEILSDEEIPAYVNS